MRISKIFALLIVIFSIQLTQAQKKYSVHTVAFYNFENLFDTINNPNNDEEWLPNGAQNWTSKKYHKKLENLARVLSEIGTGENPHSPTLIGGCEIENRGVLEDLVKQPKLAAADYGIVHFDSPDKRGIDVALLYQKKHFKPISSINVPLMIYRDEKKVEKSTEKESEEDKEDKDKIEVGNGERVYTRDILLVTGYLDGEEVNVIVNHWPSRSGGEKKSSPFREAAGRMCRKIMDSIYKINPNAKIIAMGDLNDGTYNKSVKEGIGAKRKKEEVKEFGIYNPFEQMAREGNATLFHRDAGDIFDQIMVSEPLIRNDYASFRYWKAGIYNPQYLIQKTGQYKGYPLRHGANEVGFSDHFPVYIYLIKEIK
ncbi:endonuclease/exonuclease/phosphatase family protein [Flavobacterium sp. CYK-55]|uniref:endonuclease/exonuclease/phosphatase family protein n=1 Tax=Flavobacterium sp. CYK-55 TaxID=2835529 RepID=UPI001BCF471E|nr:endonuclease/exonuclease/phosphatase family protein [Flavobacterium sp. CYK-55]MBS7786107.1 endonuclease/exonuclease/phosphatase family protein [Flavobacterium sp. CYK-55]